MRTRLLHQRLAALFVAGALFFDFPLLSLWTRGGSVAGLPLLPVALFTGWAVLMAVVAWWMERGADDTQDEPEPPRPAGRPPAGG